MTGEMDAVMMKEMCYERSEVFILCVWHVSFGVLMELLGATFDLPAV